MGGLLTVVEDGNWKGFGCGSRIRGELTGETAGLVPPEES